MIPAFLSVIKSHVLYTLTILYIGLGTKTASITWRIHLQELGVDLEQEDDAAGLLGVTLEQ